MVTTTHSCLHEWVETLKLNDILTKNEALAAVMVPWGFMNAGFSLASCSGVDTRIPLSFDTTLLVFGTVYKNYKQNIYKDFIHFIFINLKQKIRNINF